MATQTKRRSHVEADRPLARQIGARLRRARLQMSLTQAQLAEGRYTKAYVSALENGLVKPSMAALHFFAGRLQMPIERLLSDGEQAWTRLDADVRLASGDWARAVDAYTSLLETDAPETVRAELLLGLAEGQSRLGNGTEAVRAGSEAAALFAARDRRREAAWATYWEASGLHQLERSDQAAPLLNQLLDQIAAGLQVEPDLPVRILIALAVMATRDDEPERGLAYLEQARSRVGGLDDRKHAQFLHSLALGYRELGDYEAAISTGTQCLARFKAAEAESEVAAIENELALVYLALGNLRRAGSLATEAKAFFNGRSDRWRLAHVTETQGQIALAAGSASEAMALAREALQMAEGSDNKKVVLDASLLLARTQRATGELEAASDTLERAAALAATFGRRGQLQTILSEWSDVTAARGDLVEALALSRRAVDAGRH
jgi:transcriptional regulator with XRE-family HTH domain